VFCAIWSRMSNAAVKRSRLLCRTSREELRAENADPDKVFSKRRQEHTEILAAR
jgi:hypothetical protein